MACNVCFSVCCKLSFNGKIVLELGMSNRNLNLKFYAYKTRQKSFHGQQGIIFTSGFAVTFDFVIRKGSCKAKHLIL